MSFFTLKKNFFFYIFTMSSKVDIFPFETEIILNSLLKLYANVTYNFVEFLWIFHKVSWIIFIDIVLWPVKFHWFNLDIKKSAFISITTKILE